MRRLKHILALSLALLGPAGPAVSVRVAAPVVAVVSAAVAVQPVQCFAPVLVQPYRFAAFSPADISGLTLWLDADDISGADGDAVATWSAHSPTSINATQGTAAARPTLQLAEVNGHAAVQSDGVNDLLQLSSTVSATASWTVFTVQKRVSSGGNGGALGNAKTGTNFGPPFSGLEYGSLSRMYLASKTDQKYSSIPSHAWHVVTSQDNAGTLVMRVDGSNQSLTAAADTGTADFGLLFGRTATAGFTSEYWATYLACTLVYNRALNSTEMAQNEAYLKARYGTP